MKPRSPALALLVALTLPACGSDDPAPAGGGVIRVSPGATDTETLQGAFLEVKRGGTVLLAPGTYHIEKELTLVENEVTIRGDGATRDDVILDFGDQTEGDNAMEASGDGFTLENVTVVDAPGDGVKVTEADRPTFRNVRAYWSAGPSAENGAYALYPALCTNVLIEDCEVSDAADAGIYLGQSRTGIVRRNKAHGNVIGIEAENTTDVDLYENEAWDNSCGMLVVNLPNLDLKVMTGANVYDNLLRDNNHENFGVPGAFVENVPPGTGLLVVASHDVRVHGNEIRGNEGVGVALVSWATLAFLSGLPGNPDPDGYEKFTERVYVTDNTFTDNGTRPTGAYADLGLTAPIEAVVWDGVVDGTNDPTSADERRICIQNAGATFRNLDVPGLLANQTTDLAPHDCSYPALPPVTLP